MDRFLSQVDSKENQNLSLLVLGEIGRERDLSEHKEYLPSYLSFLFIYFFYVFSSCVFYSH